MLYILKRIHYWWSVLSVLFLGVFVEIVERNCSGWSCSSNFNFIFAWAPKLHSISTICWTNLWSTDTVAPSVCNSTHFVIVICLACLQDTKLEIMRSLIIRFYGMFKMFTQTAAENCNQIEGFLKGLKEEGIMTLVEDSSAARTQAIM